MASPSARPSEAAPFHCSKAELGCWLSVVRRCRPRFQSPPLRAPRGGGLVALPGEAAALGLGPQLGPVLRPGAARDQVDHAGQRVGAVEARGRAAHDLDLRQLERQGAAEVEGAARLVDRHAVHQQAHEARVAAAHEGRGLQPQAAGASGREAGRLLQQRDQGRGLALVDALGVEHRGAGAQGRERRLAARGGHQHLLAHGAGAQPRLEAHVLGADRDLGAALQLEAGRAHAQAVVARGQGGELEAPLRAGQELARAIGAFEAQGQVRDALSVGGADGAGEPAWAVGLGQGGGHRQRGEGAGQSGAVQHASLPFQRRLDAKWRTGGSRKEGRRRVLSLFTREASVQFRRAGFLASGSSLASWPSPALVGRVTRRPQAACTSEAGSPVTVAGPRRIRTCFPFTLPQREAPDGTTRPVCRAGRGVSRVSPARLRTSARRATRDLAGRGHLLAAGDSIG